MKIIRKKQIDLVCESCVETILILAESFLHGAMNYKEYNDGVQFQMYVISRIGGKKWVDRANKIITNRIQEGTKEVNYKIKGGDTNGKQ